MIKKSAISLLLPLAFIFGTSQALPTNNVQPFGNVIQVWDPVVVNEYLAKWDPNIIPGVTDPFDTRYAVLEVVPTQPSFFVRVYTEPDSGPLGSYMVRASTVRGLTPQQIRNIISLPELPTKIDQVVAPPGAEYGLWVGTAGAIMSPGYEWGEGGGEQIKIIGHQTDSNPPPDPTRFASYNRLPADSYVNPAFIGNKALSYYQRVNQGNAGNIAAYLDEFLPISYSDLESVYTILDFINVDGIPQLTQALNQMGPINYDTYRTVKFRNNLMFNNILFERSQMGAKSARKQKGANFGDELNKSCLNTWIDLAGEKGHQSAGDNRVGFNYQAGNISAGIGCQMNDTTELGVGVGYIRDNLHWSQAVGNAHINNLAMGVYSSYVQSDYFLNSALIAGGNWDSSSRSIGFQGEGFAVLSGLDVDTLTVNRIAGAKQRGNDLGLYVIGGKNFALNDWNLTPMVQGSYFYSRQEGFTEKGANDLNLTVNPITAQVLRAEFSALLGRICHLPKGTVINSNIQLGWANNFPLDNRTIGAGLSILGGDFTVNANNQNTTEGLIGANIAAQLNKQLWLDTQYKAYLSNSFTSQTVSVILKYYFEG